VQGRKSGKIADKISRRRERGISSVDRLREGMSEIERTLVPPIPLPWRESTVPGLVFIGAAVASSIRSVFRCQGNCMRCVAVKFPLVNVPVSVSVVFAPVVPIKPGN
jgi:hypothetical protein